MKLATMQINLTALGEDLKLTLGPNVGGLHVDYKDDAARFTVLLGLHNLKPGWWPGRTLITSLRAYCVLAPMTVLVFKAGHTHLSLAPAPPDPERKPYQPSVEDVPELDDAKYIYSRCAVVNYARTVVIDKSAEIVRTKTPVVLQAKDFQESRNPEALPAGLIAFGTLQNQMEKLAQQKGLLHAREVASNPNRKLAPYAAADCSDAYIWIDENGVGHLPRVDLIQKVIDNNGPGAKDCQIHKDYAELRAYNLSLLSQNDFGHQKKSGEPVWVEVDQIGSTFGDLSLIGKKKASTGLEKKKKETSTAPKEKEKPPYRFRRYADEYAEFGEKPWECPVCYQRVLTPDDLVQHHRKRHEKDVDFFPVEPSMYPGDNVKGAKIVRKRKGHPE
jgi:hypothetical protein